MSRNKKEPTFVKTLRVNLEMKAFLESCINANQFVIQAIQSTDEYKKFIVLFQDDPNQLNFDFDSNILENQTKTHQKSILNTSEDKNTKKELKPLIFNSRAINEQEFIKQQLEAIKREMIAIMGTDEEKFKELGQQYREFERQLKNLK